MYINDIAEINTEINAEIGTNKLANKITHSGVCHKNNNTLSNYGIASTHNLYKYIRNILHKWISQLARILLKLSIHIIHISLFMIQY